VERDVAAGQTNRHTFTVPAGSGYLDSQLRNNAGLVVELREGTNGEVFNNVSATADGAVCVAAVGDVYGGGAGGANNSGAYQVRMLDLGSSPALALNGPVSGPLGRMRRWYQFSGVAGQRPIYDAVEGDNDNVVVRMVTPANTVSYLNQNSDTDSSGSRWEWRDVLSGGREQPWELVDYSFRLWDLGAQAVLPLDQELSGSLTRGGDEGVSARRVGRQRLYFEGMGSASGANGSVWAEQPVCGRGGIDGDFEVTLGTTGRYALVLDGSANPVAYQVKVVTPTAGGRRWCWGRW
jgi:hypothetical protein